MESIFERASPSATLLQGRTRRLQSRIARIVNWSLWRSRAPVAYIATLPSCLSSCSCLVTDLQQLRKGSTRSRRSRQASRHFSKRRKRQRHLEIGGVGHLRSSLPIDYLCPRFSLAFFVRVHFAPFVVGESLAFHWQPWPALDLDQGCSRQSSPHQTMAISQPT